MVQRQEQQVGEPMADYTDWFVDHLNIMIQRMQMHPGNDNMIFVLNQVRLFYIQGKKEGRV
jgi:hypothetical protein